MRISAGWRRTILRLASMTLAGAFSAGAVTAITYADGDGPGRLGLLALIFVAASAALWATWLASSDS